jgi:adenylate cyclase
MPSSFKEKIHSSQTVQWAISIATGSGRLPASIVLIGATLLMLLADWPAWWTPLPKPLVTIVDLATDSYTSGRHFLFDRYQREAPRKVESQPVTIVAIDEKSLAKIGQWPWPRHRLAALIDAIGKYEPAAVGLDIYMPEADQTSPGQLAISLEKSQPDLAQRLRTLPSNDEILANSLRKTPSVLGAAGFDFKTYTTSEGLRTRPLNFQNGNSLPDIVREYPAVLASLPLLQSAAAGQALLSVDSDDGTVRRVTLLSSVNGEPVPSLAIEMFRVAMDQQAIGVELNRFGVAALNVGDLRVPTQTDGSVFIHSAHSAETLNRYVSALDVLENRVDPQALSGKLVLIGLTGMGLNDMRITTLGEHVPGIEIQAQLIESFFDQRFVQRPWWLIFAEMGLALLSGTLMIWLIPRVQSNQRFGVIYRIPIAGVIGSFGINALAIALGFYLFRKHGLMLDAASLFLVTSAVFGILFALAQASAARAKEALRQRQWDELVQRAEQSETALRTHLSSTGEKK